MKLPVRIAPIVFSSLLLATGVANAANWEEISLAKLAKDGLIDIETGELLDSIGNAIKDQGGEGEALVPSCAGGPVPEADKQFRFFVQTGDPKKLLILHDGGGACWEDNTCADPFDDPLIEGIIGSYDRTINESVESLAFAGGILNSDLSSPNPLKGWTKVFIPYCTGDVGWGNQDTPYTYPPFHPSAGQPFTVHHRGYANIRAVLRWVEDYYTDKMPPSNIMIAGTSAGAYAAPVVILPEVKKLFPSWWVKTYVLADSGNGVVTKEFLDAAKLNWGLDRTLPDYLQEVLDQGADGLSVRLYSELAVRYPTTRFGQFQNAYDGIQTVVYNTMKHVNDPLSWKAPGALVSSLIEWSASARLAVNLSAWAPNYRFYTAAGTEHLVLVNVPPQANAGFCSDDFDTEKSAGGLYFHKWVDDMVNKPSFFWSTGNWRNATCFPNCLPAPQATVCPTPTPQ